MEFVGYIRNTSTFSGKSKGGKSWTAYNAEIHPINGEPQKLSFGFDKPDVREGDYVYLEADKDAKGYVVVDQSTIERRDPPEVPASTKGDEIAEKFKENVASGQATNFGEFNRQTNPEDAKRMRMSAARTDAIAMISMLLEYSALPMSVAQNKAGTAKRFDEITAAVDKFTVKFYNDNQTLRLLETVADTQPSTAAKSELPNPDGEEKEANEIDE